MLEDGLHGVPAGHTASVVTHLEMLEEAPQRPEADLALDLVRVERPGPDWYLDLFRAVGAPWLWFGRLEMARADLEALLNDARVHGCAMRGAMRVCWNWISACRANASWPISGWCRALSGAARGAG